MKVQLAGRYEEKTNDPIKQNELTAETYPYFCRLYLSKFIAEEKGNIKYRVITAIINSIDPILFQNLKLETNKYLLLEQIYSLFMEEDEKISREFLYDKISYISKFDPELIKGMVK